jgi:hypothetical protein
MLRFLELDEAAETTKTEVGPRRSRRRNGSSMAERRAFGGSFMVPGGGTKGL